MSEVLKKLGLTPEQVRKAFGVEAPPPFRNRKLDGTNYHSAAEQRRMRRRLKVYEGWMLSRFLEGYHPGTISRILGCSEESVRIRLRKHRLA